MPKSNLAGDAITLICFPSPMGHIQNRIKMVSSGVMKPLNGANHYSALPAFLRIHPASYSSFGYLEIMMTVHASTEHLPIGTEWPTGNHLFDNSSNN
jgi:hypothetical protein